MRALSTCTGSSLGPTGGRGRSLRKWKSHRKGVSRSRRFSCTTQGIQEASRVETSQGALNAPLLPQAAGLPSRLPAWTRRCGRAAVAEKRAAASQAVIPAGQPWTWWGVGEGCAGAVGTTQHNVPPGACAAWSRRALCAHGAQPGSTEGEGCIRLVHRSTHDKPHTSTSAIAGCHAAVSTHAQQRPTQGFGGGSVGLGTQNCARKFRHNRVLAVSRLRLLHYAATAERPCREGRAARSAVRRPAACVTAPVPGPRGVRRADGGSRSACPLRLCMRPHSPVCLPACLPALT